MGYTYSGDPSKSNLDAVRFEIGDTVEQKYLLKDEEINYALAKEGSVLRACARLCEGLAARFAREEEVRTNAYTTNRSNICTKFKEMATRFRARGTKSTSFVVPAISVTEKEAVVANADLVQPSFYRDIMDNVEAATEQDLAVDE